MKRIIKCVNWRTFSALCCIVGLISVCDANSETLQCTQKQILNGDSFDGLYSNICNIKSEGQNLSSSDCTVWDLGEGENGLNDCSNLQFSPSSSAYVSGVEIYPYVDAFPNFNINFRNIQWHYMQYRLHLVSSGKSWCYKLQFNSFLVLQHLLHVSFACSAFTGWAAGYDAELLVDVGNSPSDITSHAHYVMKVLPDKNSQSTSIRDWVVLVAVDISHKPDLLVYWPAVPDRFGVTKYKVQIGDDRPEEVTLSSCPNGYCFHKMFAGYASRSVSVSVKLVHEDCLDSCSSSSPVISLEFSMPVYFLILMALAPILVVLIVICSIYFFCCAAPRDPLEVLLLYDATTYQHYNVVRILAEYLKEVGNVHCLLDMVEIPRTESQNPYKWLHKTIDAADAVLYVASPPTHWDIRFSKYPYVVYEALTLIQKRRSCPAHSRPGRFLVAVPPYCSKEDIPESLRDVTRFSIPKEMNWLLWSLYNQQCWRVPFTWMAKTYLLCGWCPGPMSAYHRHGGKLAGALTVANAKQTLDEQRPGTPPSGSIWTELGNPDILDKMSVTYAGFPGPLEHLPRGLDGSLVSKDGHQPGWAGAVRSPVETALHEDNEEDNSSMPYRPPLNTLPLLGMPDGSQVSEDSLAPRFANNMGGLEQSGAL